ncbi:hypothetical protein M231_03461 [Tremella mesenterica]|uniref:Uncharacterized protein n=1 Tax=Tremella mesenterica TaxID=5217 RepID=A0A4Q1BN14_TREME|nr:hypothetical protein M231_03461 [Tremella mesenterica]
MPSELLQFPPLYTLVGIYRILTDPLVRTPVLDKIRHASIRGLIVGALYAAGTWRPMGWFVRRFLVGGQRFLGIGLGSRGKVGEAVGESMGGVVHVGMGRLSVPVDLVLYTHMLVLLPQLSSILRFFIYKNLRIARSRAYALTVSSRGKPSEFWSQGYVEEWANPPKPRPGDMVKGSRRSTEARWVSWILWWPTQIVIRHYLLIPLSPNLPLLAPLFTSTLRALTTAEYLHTPYFDIKGMSAEERWRWVEERKWAYRSFGFAASVLESIPILGLFLSITNRIGAAMWAFDLEKRQHLFSHQALQPLPPSQVGFFGSGGVSNTDLNIQAAEEEIERRWSQKPHDDSTSPAIELQGSGLGVSEAGKEKVL